MTENTPDPAAPISGVPVVQETSAPANDLPAMLPARGPRASLPIVAIGASAGGLEALSRLFDAMSAAIVADDERCGVLAEAAFLVVQHLDPTHHSLMAELLAKHTAMTVAEASEGCALAAGHVYIIPPGRYLTVTDGRLHLAAPPAPQVTRLPFDVLLRSLAQCCGPRATGVILSGTGTDGSLGLTAIGQAGGLVIAQDLQEAEFDGMPRSAVATGHVHQILHLIDMPGAIATRAHQILGHDARPDSLPDEPDLPPSDAAPDGQDQVAQDSDTVRDSDAAALAAILSFLYEHTAQDFRQYKSGTIVRRIERRLGLLGIERGDLSGYLDLLHRRPLEGGLLAKDLLIHVTCFFRDPKVFDALGKTIIPEIIQGLAAQQTLRVWVAGCSTGEEAYSIAMVCRDAITAAGRGIKLQIFASDVDPDAIAVARDGLYPAEISETVPAERLARYFTREDGAYRIMPGLRGDVVFTVQDVLSDPPFSRMDLVSCRNLLIYLNPQAQAKVISLFHFALREGGILMLGSSETVGKSAGRFEVIAKSERFYRHAGRSRLGEPGFPLSFGDTQPRAATPSRDVIQARQSSLADICAKAILAGHAPAAVLINRERQVLFSMGPTNRYLQLAPGYASHDLLAMAAPALRRKLKLAIDKAVDDSPPGVHHEPAAAHGPSSLPVHRDRTRLTVDGTTIWFSIAVNRLSGGNEDLLLVCFLDEPASDTVVPSAHGQLDTSRIAELERELQAARAELQVSIQNEETSHQEQKAINEEALSVNEEFQSTNEELLTSKEELQSLNEELTALNSQLQETLERQRLTSDDLQNVLFSTNIGTLFLDIELKIRFYTPAVSGLFHIIPGDVGRPLADLRSIAADDTLLADAQQVVSGAIAIDREVSAPGSTIFLRRIFPYLTHDGRIEGVVITFADITERKIIEQALEATKLEAERANLAKSRFLAAASHDLRQPLQSLTLLKELLVQAVDGEKPQQLLMRFEQTLRTISGMLNALLDSNQIEAGVVRPKLVAFPLADVFATMLDEFGYVAQARGLALHVVPTSIIARTDPHLLEQVLRNLLGNAIKYTEHGKILLGARRQGQSVRITVGDTGIGIPRDQLDAIFEEFHQIGNDARERSRGLGMGLSIVQRLGRLLDHAIAVQSQPGKGSFFTITVPMAQAVDTPGLTALPDAATGQPRHCKVVVVDDDPDILELLELLLKAEGCIVSTASDGAAALKLVAGLAIRPEILLTDHNLPGGMTGLDLLAQLRVLLDHDLPAIILTGDIAAESLARIAGQDCIQLSKPVDPRALVQAIRQLCPQDPAPLSGPAGQSVATICVIDDDPVICATIGEVLQGHGRPVCAFGSAEAFIAADRSGNEACLLVDAHLPGMSGIDLIKALRARGDQLPAIVMTGDGDIALVVEAMRAGACEFIEKPVSRADLLASVARAIAQSHDIRLVHAVRDEAAALVAELTIRQREVMDRVLAGQASKNIAADLDISQRTVENHRAAIMQRMNVKSLPELARLVVLADLGHSRSESEKQVDHSPL